MGLFSSIAGSLIGGLGSIFGAKEQGKADKAAINEQRRQFDIIMGMQQPYQTVGVGALNTLANTFGLPTYQQPATGISNPNPERFRVGGMGSPGSFAIPGYVGSQFVGRPNTNAPGTSMVPQAPAQAGPNMSGFFQSPGYQFRLNEGLRATEQSAAARGGAFSGNALQGLNDYGQGMASNEFSNWYNQLANLAGLGQTSANASSGFAQRTGEGIANSLYNRGNARASGIQGVANAIGGGLQDYEFWKRYGGGNYGNQGTGQ